MTFGPTDINLRCGRVPAKLADGSSVWIPGFYKEATIVKDAEYVEDEFQIFLSKSDIGVRKRDAVSLTVR